MTSTSSNAVAAKPHEKLRLEKAGSDFSAINVEGQRADVTSVSGAEQMREALQYACDLLAERKYGNSARSPAHNARIELERIIRALPLPAPERDTKPSDENIFARMADDGGMPSLSPNTSCKMELLTASEIEAERLATKSDRERFRNLADAFNANLDEIGIKPGTSDTAPALDRIAERAKELTDKHGNPNGTDYEQGVQDHGHRIYHAIIALQSPAEGK